MALARRYFEVLAVYLPKHSAAIEIGDAAVAIVRHIEGAAG
jgi:hypothetical protein